MRLGAVRQRWPGSWRLVAIRVPRKDEEINEQTFNWRLRKAKLRQVRRREGRYLLRTNLMGEDPVKLWEYYTQLTQVEEAFKNLKGDLALRPVYHQKADRIEAHIFVAFLAYCLHATLRRWLRRTCAGTDTSIGDGKICCRSNDRCSSTHDGWSPRYSAALYAAGERASSVAGPIEARFARAAATSDHVSWQDRPVSPCSADLLESFLDYEPLTPSHMPE